MNFDLIPHNPELRGKDLLIAVRDEILAEPLRLEMNLYIADVTAEDSIELPVEYAPACGTIGCIAGWATLIGRRHKDVTPLNAEATARRFLGIDEADAQCLFYNSEWPQRFQDRWNKISRNANVVTYLEVKQAQAIVVADVIDNFIETRMGAVREEVQV